LEDLSAKDIENFYQMLRSPSDRIAIELALQIAETNRIPFDFDIYQKLISICYDLNKDYLDETNLVDCISFLNNTDAIYIDSPQQLVLLKYHRLFNTINRFQAWGLDLNSIPKQLQYFKSLHTIDLGSNNLKELPHFFKEFHSLEQLHLFSNAFSNFPTTIFDLPSIKEIQLGANHLKSLPELIGNLTQLRYLGLTDNRISKIPASLFELKNLEVVSLVGNPIPKEQIAALKQALPNCTIYHS